MGLPDSSQPVMVVIVGVMMAVRWLEAHVTENDRHEEPTNEQLQELDCHQIYLFETMCKILNIPMLKKKILARRPDAMVQSQHDCMVVRVYQKAYDEAQ